MTPPEHIALQLPTDEDLVTSVKHGDDEAFKQLMNRYIGQLRNFIRQYTRVPEDAEDILQDSFFKAWKYIRRFKEGKAFKPWLYTIARNTALDHVKKRRAAPFSDLDDVENDLPFAETIADTEPLAHTLFEQKQSAEELESILGSLHPEHRAVLLMHYRDEMTFDDIADVIGKPMNTVKSWHRRALIKLRSTLNDGGHLSYDI